MVEVSVRQRPAPTMAVATPLTTTISMVAVQAVQRHVLTMVAERPQTTTTSMVVARAVLQLAPTIVGATQRITTISMVAARAVLQHVPTTVEAQPPTITTSMEVALVRQRPALIMAVEPPRHIMTLTAIALGQVTVQVTIGNILEGYQFSALQRNDARDIPGILSWRSNKYLL